MFENILHKRVKLLVVIAFALKSLLLLIKLKIYNIMKKILLSVLFLSSIGASAQITIFEDSFETYTDFAITGVGGWTVTDLDLLTTYGIEQGTPAVSVVFANSGAPMAFMVMNSSATVPVLNAAAWAGKTGAKCMAAMAGIPTATVIANNDYLISPQIQLGLSGNTVKFWAKSISTSYPEKFKVGISTTGTAPANFTMITPTAGVTPTTSWVEYSYPLDAYQGQNVYIAIQCLSVDAFALLIDDFKVSATVLSTENFFKSNFAVYPNPATDVINISNVNGLEITKSTITDINGRIVKEINSSVNSINVSDLTTGVYFLNVTTTTGNGTTKIVKK